MIIGQDEQLVQKFQSCNKNGNVPIPPLQMMLPVFF